MIRLPLRARQLAKQEPRLRGPFGDEAALKVKPCETIEIVPLRERAERRPALSHSRIAALSCLSAAFTR
jgi:hypothetical protein